MLGSVWTERAFRHKINPSGFKKRNKKNKPYAWRGIDGEDNFIFKNTPPLKTVSRNHYFTIVRTRSDICCYPLGAFVLELAMCLMMKCNCFDVFLDALFIYVNCVCFTRYSHKISHSFGILKDLAPILYLPPLIYTKIFFHVLQEILKRKKTY